MKIKLRDMTREQYEKWLKNNCTTKILCGDCPFFKVFCCDKNRCWINNKDLYSDKFLDQEIEIEDEPILTDEETKAWLEDKIIPLGITRIIKNKEDIKFGDIKEGICLDIPNDNPVFEKFLKLESDRFYKIKDLIKRDNEILNLQERQYLRAVIKPFRDNVKTIEKIGSEYLDSDNDFVVIHLEEDCISIPIIEDLNFKGMEFEFSYTLEELGL